MLWGGGALAVVPLHMHVRSYLCWTADRRVAMGIPCCDRCASIVAFALCARTGTGIVLLQLNSDLSLQIHIMMSLDISWKQRLSPDAVRSKPQIHRTFFFLGLYVVFSCRIHQIPQRCRTRTTPMVH